VRLVPLVLLLNAGFLVAVVRGELARDVSPDLDLPVVEAPTEGSAPQRELRDHLPLPGMEGWNESGSACVAMEAFLQAASIELERAGHQAPVRPGQKILHPDGVCRVDDLGTGQLLNGYRAAFAKAGLDFPVEAP